MQLQRQSESDAGPRASSQTVRLLGATIPDEALLGVYQGGTYDTFYD